MQRRTFAVALATALTGCSGAIADGSSGNTSGTDAPDNLIDAQWDGKQTAKTIHDEINARRVDDGKGELRWDEELASIASDYARKMADEGFFDHTAPSGDTFEDRYAEAGYQCRVNLPGDSYKTVSDVVADPRRARRRERRVVHRPRRARRGRRRRVV